MTEPPRSRPLRIVAVADGWFGSNGRALVAALRRLDHRVAHIDPGTYWPAGWRSETGRYVRRGIERLAVRELGTAILAELDRAPYDVLLVFKGQWVPAVVIRSARASGVLAVNVFPDNSFVAHGKRLSESILCYDVVFGTKEFHERDLRDLGFRGRVESFQHGYDPELHRPMELTAREQSIYACDASFIGTWSPKKARLLRGLLDRVPGLDLKVWGAQWSKAPELGACVQRRGVLGWEYVAAINGSAVNLAILSEARTGASSDDQVTSRSFHIPASGGFMLHERTDEILRYFDEGDEIVCFEGEDEFAERVVEMLADPDRRRAMADAARTRCVEDGYSVDARAAEICAWISRNDRGEGGGR